MKARDDRRPRAIILISYAVAPDMGSEPGVGWQFLRAAEAFGMDNGVAVHLVCNDRSSRKLQQGAAAEDPSMVHRRHVVTAPFERHLAGKNERLAYLLWTMLARRRVAALTRSLGPGVIVHQVTFASEVLPIALPRTASASRIWGPIGSSGSPWVFGVGPPQRALTSAGRRQRLRNGVARHLAGRSARRADMILLQSEFVRIGKAKPTAGVRVFPNFIPPDLLVNRRRSPTDMPGLQLVCVGQLVRLKRVDLAIRALAEERLREAQLVVLGGGPLLAELQELARLLQVEARVHFAGEVPREEVAQHLERSDALVHLSAREGASGVIAEASMLGLPVVCFAGTGAAATLTYGGGAGVIVAGPPPPTVARLADSIHEAAHLAMPPSKTWNPARLRNLLDEIYRVPAS